MKWINSLIIFLMAPALSCIAQQTYTVTGYIKGIGHTKVMLGNKSIPGVSSAFKKIYYDSCYSDNDKFIFKGHIDGPVFCSIEIPELTKKWAGFILENKNIYITGNKDSIYRSYISGSSQTDDYKFYLDSLYHPESKRLNKAIDSLRSIKDTVGRRQRERTALAPYWQKMSADLYAYIKKHPSNLGLLKELWEDRDFMSIPLDSARKYYDAFTLELKASTLGKQLNYVLNEYPKIIGLKKPMPDFSMADSSGHIRKLSEFRGKYVILDFWASWCGPCLAELPELKRVDSIYHSRGLQVVGISMDTNKQLWTNAIANNKMTWVNLSDLEGEGNRAARLLNVQSIPYMSLLDEKGNIILDKASLSKVEEFLSNTLQ
jgi:peroxiredoxin